MGSEGELVARVCIVLGRGIIKKWTSVQWNQLTIANDRKTNKKGVLNAYVDLMSL